MKEVNISLIMLCVLSGVCHSHASDKDNKSGDRARMSRRFFLMGSAAAVVAGGTGLGRQALQNVAQATTAAGSPAVDLVAQRTAAMSGLPIRQSWQWQWTTRSAVRDLEAELRQHGFVRGSTDLGRLSADKIHRTMIEMSLTLNERNTLESNITRYRFVLLAEEFSKATGVPFETTKNLMKLLTSTKNTLTALELLAIESTIDAGKMEQLFEITEQQFPDILESLYRALGGRDISSLLNFNQIAFTDGDVWPSIKDSQSAQGQLGSENEAARLSELHQRVKTTLLRHKFPFKFG